MVNVGERIEVAAAKTAPTKRGKVVAKEGAILTVEWDDGHRSSFSPAPGAVRVEKPAVPARR
jgi:hypothetical protein